MEKFLEIVTLVNGKINDFVWGPIMLVLLVGTGVFLTFRTGWIQVRWFGYIMKNTVGSLFRKKDAQDHGSNLSPFQAVTTALAGTVGTGNIAGVTGAIFMGGPGAVFWMWVSAFFGMCTKYAEIALALKFRNTDGNGVHKGGPMYYIENGLGKNWKLLAVLFALLGGLASFGIGNIAQSSEIAGAMFYVVAGIVVVLMRITDIPGVLAAIFTSAFSFEAVGGGVFGYAIMVAMKNGFARGVFSNEAGLGSAPIAHAASSTQEPAEQAIWGVFEVFFDTIVICSITAFTVLLSGFELSVASLETFGTTGAAAVAAFNSILPGTLGGTIIQASLIFFALSTILSWSYYGERCWGYLSRDNKVVTSVYKVIFVLFCIVGATGSGQLMWNISDTLNGAMAIPNLVALLALSGVVATITKDYFSEKK